MSRIPRCYHPLGWLVLLMLFGSLQAQEIRTDLDRIQQAYEQEGSGMINLEYRQYSGYPDEEPEIVQGAYHWDSHSQYLQLPGTEHLKNENYAILVNHQMQAIVVQDAPKVPSSRLDIPLDSLLAICDSVSFSTTPEGWHAWRLEINTSLIMAVSLVFDPVSYQIRKLVRWEQPFETEDQIIEPRLEIHYLRLRPLAQGKARFAESRFLKRNGDAFLPQTAYQHYQVYNYCR